MADLFSAAHESDDDGPSGTVAAPRASAPLAVRMRPRTLEEVLGQRHLMRPGSPLRKLAEPDPGSPAGPRSGIRNRPPGRGQAPPAPGVRGRHTFARWTPPGTGNLTVVG